MNPLLISFVQRVEPFLWDENSRRYIQFSNGRGATLFHLFFLGGEHFRKYKVLVTGVKVISKKICWEQLVEGGGWMPRLFIYFISFFFGGGRWTSLILRGGENNILLVFYFYFAGETLSQVQSNNNWYGSSNLTYNLILNESTLSLTCV